MSLIDKQINSFYKTMAEEIKNKDLNSITNKLSPDFRSILPDNSIKSREEWIQVMQDEFKNNDFHDVFFFIENIETNGDTASVYLNKKYVVKNQNNQHIDSTAKTHDIVSISGNQLSLKEIKTISRDFILDGHKLIIQEKERAKAMVQGCGDDYIPNV